MNNFDRIRPFLLEVQKPSRYIGNELNIIVKKDANIRVAISYPDLYEVAMSNNGIRILYDIANSIDDVACERVFAVEKDFEELLKREKIQLYTLETFFPLNKLDILAFNFAHELIFTNVLQILDLGNIPFLKEERTEEHPLVIAGGACTSNPLPMMDFIDLFFLGDGEEGFQEILETYRDLKNEGKSKDEILSQLQNIQGVLISSAYEIFYENNKIISIDGPRVKKRIYSKEKICDPINPVVSNMSISQERAVVELTKGCKNLCKFCHAGFYDLPYRKNNFLGVKEKIFAILKNTGYDELTISSLSISDYNDLTALLNEILPELTSNGISISLPSLKVDLKTLDIINLISELRKTSLTFAVESASDEIRSIANKKVYIDELLYIIKEVYEKGWKLIKLYFMIGLPGADKVDEAESIINLIKKIREITDRKMELNITVSPFIPKVHTPFEREQQYDREYIGDVVLKIKRGLPRSVRIKNHDTKASLIEGVFSRGDTRLGKVLLQSYRDGCRFDSWREHFNFYVWEKNLNEIIPNWRDFLKKREEDELLPWEIVQTGFERLKESRKTQLLDFSAGNKFSTNFSEELNVDSVHQAFEKFKETKYIVKKIGRFTFTKEGKAAYISHLDFMEIIKRFFRIHSAPIAFTQGFNKRERISAGYPVPLGVESLCELLDVDLHDLISEDKIAAMQKKGLPHGIEFKGFHYIEKGRALMEEISFIDYLVEFNLPENLSNFISQMKPDFIFTKKTKKRVREILLGDTLSDFKKIDEKNLLLKLSVGDSNSMRIDRFLNGILGKDLQLYVKKFVKLKSYNENFDVVE